MDEIRKELDDLKGLCVATSLLVNEMARVLASVAPGAMDEVLQTLGATAEGSAKAGDRTKAHLKEAVAFVRAQIESQIATW